MRVELFKEDPEKSINLKAVVNRVEIPLVSAKDEQYKILIVDADDSLDIIVHCPNGEREAVWSLVKDGPEAGNVRHGDYLSEPTDPATLYSLCGNCWVITQSSSWAHYVRDADGVIMAPADEEDPAFSNCPNCNYSHVDDDSDPGVWEGNFDQMESEREENMPEEADTDA